MHAFKTFFIGYTYTRKALFGSFQVTNGSVLWNPTLIKQISWDTILTFIDKQHTTLNPLFKVCKRVQNDINCHLCCGLNNNCVFLNKINTQKTWIEKPVTTNPASAFIACYLLSIYHNIKSKTHHTDVPSCFTFFEHNQNKKKEALSCLALYSDVNCIWEFVPHVTCYTFK